MPSNEDRDSVAGAGAPVDIPAGQTPQFNVGDLKDSLRGFAQELVGEAEKRLRQANAPRPQPDPEPEGLTDEEMESFTPVQRQAIEKGIRRGVHAVRRELGALRDTGLSRIADLTERNMETQLPYYKEFKSEIKAELAGLDPALRTDPNAIEMVHDRIAMRHMPDIIKRTEDEALRRARGDAPAPSGNTGRVAGGRTPASDAIPTPEELFNEDQLSEIDRAGGPDAFARKVTSGRLNSWDEYAKANAKFKSAKRQGLRGNIIEFARLTPGKGVGQKTG